MFKRLLSLTITITILIMSTCITSFAKSNEDTTEKEYLYEHLLPDPMFYRDYDEVYYHRVNDNDPDSIIDWAIVYYEPIASTPSGIVRIVLDRVICSGEQFVYYPVGWAIYVAELNKIVSIDQIDVTKYDGLEQALIECRVGNPFGDADYDGVLTIADATYIQRVEAELTEYRNSDSLLPYGTWGVNYDRPLNYISDIDGDGERSILDATAIQMKLAKK